MTDLEMTKLAAKAMGFEDVRIETACMGTQYVAYGPRSIAALKEFRPLHDDTQAMALVKRFRIGVQYMGSERWVAWLSGPDEDAREPQSQHAQSNELNRAIVECVAKMQASVSPPDNAEAKSP